MPALIEQLRDIEGIDPIGPWPLAIGWWLALVGGLLILASVLWLWKRRRAYLNSWQKDTYDKLNNLERQLSAATAGETVVLLSEYLRRIALRRFPRQDCAGLCGERWLKWLTLHDPAQFDWMEKGQLLVAMPYAPAPQETDLGPIKELIGAVRRWVR